MKIFSAMLSLILLASAFAVTGCETMREHKVASGAVIGTAAGAAAGAAIGGKGDRLEGALIGGAAGAAIGTGVGYYLDRHAKRYERVQGVEVVKVPQQTTEPLPPSPSYAEAGRTDPLPTTTAPPHLTLRISNEVLFAKDSSVLRAEGVDKIRQIAEILNEDSTARVVVKGFASSEGSDSYNLRLSQDRATMVKNQLIADGNVAESRITALGFGESSPIADNSTEAGRARNRRVEIDVIPQNQ